MNFINTIDQIISLAKEEIATDEALKEKHGIGIALNISSPEASAYMSDHHSREDQLEKYLNTLSTEVLAKLETIMYFGRDSEEIHGNDIIELYQELHGTPEEKSITASNIADKLPALETYFGSAKNKAESLSINLETII